MAAAPGRLQQALLQQALLHRRALPLRCPPPGRAPRSARARARAAGHALARVELSNGWGCELRVLCLSLPAVAQYGPADGGTSLSESVDRKPTTTECYCAWYASTGVGEHDERYKKPACSRSAQSFFTRSCTSWAQNRRANRSTVSGLRYGARCLLCQRERTRSGTLLRPDAGNPPSNSDGCCIFG